MKKALFPLLAALAGLAAAKQAGIPGGAFLGAIVGGALVRLLHTKSLPPPAPLQNFARIILGVSIGVQVNSRTVEIAVSSGIPLMIMVITLIAVSLLFAWILTRLTGMDLATSMCGSAPGAAATMILLAEELKGNSSVVAVIHSFKILIIVMMMPFLTRLFPVEVEMFPVTAAADTAAVFYAKLAFLMAAGIAAAKLLRKAGFPTAEILAGLLVAAVCNPLFLSLERFPPLWQLFSIWILGTSIGTQMSRESLGAIKKYAVSCALLVLALAALGMLLGWLLHKYTSVEIITALIGTCPTGMDAMVILAGELHTNVPLVAAMHCARVIIVMVVVPLLIRRATAKKQRA